MAVRGDAAVENVQHQRLRPQHAVPQREFRGLQRGVEVARDSVPRRFALPPLPSATRSKASGIEASPLPASSDGSSASLFARKCQPGASLSPRKVSVARKGAGARPARATSMRERSPFATSPSRGAVRPAGAGSTAVATRSLR